MPVILMKQLLEAGVHFGHQTRRWNPKMSEYIFTERNSIHIIDLQKTVKKVDDAYAAMRELAEKGDILFVGTKKQAQDSMVQRSRLRIPSRKKLSVAVSSMLTTDGSAVLSQTS